MIYGRKGNFQSHKESLEIFLLGKSNPKKTSTQTGKHIFWKVQNMACESKVLNFHKTDDFTTKFMISTKYSLVNDYLFFGGDVHPSNLRARYPTITKFFRSYQFPNHLFVVSILSKCSGNEMWYMNSLEKMLGSIWVITWNKESNFLSSWWFQRFFIFTPSWGTWSSLTNIFQMGWNHQLVMVWDHGPNLGGVPLTLKHPGPSWALQYFLLLTTCVWEIQPAKPRREKQSGSCWVRANLKDNMIWYILHIFFFISISIICILYVYYM